MQKQIILSRDISVGQKTRESARFGDGFNYRVEAAFALDDFDRERAEMALAAALNKIDHKALGVDVDLGFEPTSQNLCRFLADEIRKTAPLRALVLIRGDGSRFEFILAP